MWKIEKKQQPDIGAFLKKQINTEKEKKKTYIHIRASLVAQMIRNPPAMQETQVQSLDWEDPLEKEMATHSSILAWRIPQTEEPGRLQSVESQRVIYVCVCVCVCIKSGNGLL